MSQNLYRGSATLEEKEKWMKLFTFAASLRKDSVNKKLIAVAEELLKKQEGVTIDHAEFNEFEMPLYNADIEKEEIPESVSRFVKRMHQAQGIIISSPEYNYSIPGPFKNLIDWVSRVNPMPWKNQCILVLTASPSLVGGNRSFWNVRIPLEGCGAWVSPSMFSLPSAYEAFDEKGALKDINAQMRLEEILKGFIDFTRRLKRI